MWYVWKEPRIRGTHLRANIMSFKLRNILPCIPVALSRYYGGYETSCMTLSTFYLENYGITVYEYVMQDF